MQTPKTRAIETNNKLVTSRNFSFSKWVHATIFIGSALALAGRGG